MASESLRVDDAAILVDLCTLRSPGGGCGSDPFSTTTESQIVLETSGGWDRMTVSLSPDGGWVCPSDLSGTLYRAGFPAFALSGVCAAEEFFGWLRAKPVVLVTAVRLNYLFLWLAGVGALGAVSRFLQSDLERGCGDDSARCLFTLGSSQILLFLYPRSLEHGLRVLDDVAHATAASMDELWEIAADVRRAEGPLGSQLREFEQQIKGALRDHPIGVFSKTKTSLAWRAASDRQQAGMEPMIEPGAVTATVAVDVAPGRERHVQRVWRKHFPEASRCGRGGSSGRCQGGTGAADAALSYGLDDLRVPLIALRDLDDFLRRLDGFRAEMLPQAGRFTTTTTFLLPTEAAGDVMSTRIDGEPVREALESALEALREQTRQASSVRGSREQVASTDGASAQLTEDLTDLVMAANASLSDPEVGGDFYDLYDPFEQLAEVLHQFVTQGQGDTAWLLDIRNYVRALMQGLHERDRSLWQDGSAPGLQFHSHACGTHAALRAYEVFASSVVSSATAELAEKRAWRWRGCVMSSPGDGMYSHPGGVIAVPMRALLRPIPSLLRIGHECGHILFGLTYSRIDRIPEEDFPEKAHLLDVDGVITSIQDYGYPVQLALDIVNEAYAHVFEYTFFRRDLRACLTSVWGGWADTDLVWQNPSAAHLRTAAFHAIELLQDAGRASDLARGGQALEELAVQASDAATGYIESLPVSAALRDQCAGAGQLTSDLLQMAYIPAIHCFLTQGEFLDTIYNVRWVSEEDQSVLSQQASAILDGHVITDPVPNIVELAFRLSEGREWSADGVPSRAQIAALLTLAHIYDVNCAVHARTKEW